MDYKPKKDTKIQITEIFTAKAGKDWSRYFHGTITREKDKNNKEISVFSSICIKSLFKFRMLKIRLLIS